MGEEMPTSPTVAAMDRDLAIDAVAAGTAVGVAFYVASWALAGAWQSGYDPARQAISELFALGAPTPGRVLLVVALVTTGIGLVGFGWALAARVRGAQAAGIAAAVSGVAFIYPPNVAAQLHLPLSVVIIALHGLAHTGALTRHRTARGVYASQSAR